MDEHLDTLDSSVLNEYEVSDIKVRCLSHHHLK